MEPGFREYNTHFVDSRIGNVPEGLRDGKVYARMNNPRNIRPLSRGRIRDALGILGNAFQAGVLHRRSEIEKLHPGNRLRRELQAADQRKAGVTSDTMYYHSHTKLTRVNTDGEIDPKGSCLIINGQLYGINAFSEDDPRAHTTEHAYIIRRRQAGYNYTLIPLN